MNSSRQVFRFIIVVNACTLGCMTASPPTQDELQEFVEAVKGDVKQRAEGVFVDLSNANIRFKDLKNLKRYSGFITELSVAGTSIGDAEVRAIGSLKRLQNLDLNDTQVSAKGLASLNELALLGIGLENCPNVTDAAIIEVAKFSELERIAISNTGVTDQGFHQLRNCHQLRVIWLSNTHVSDSGLKAVEKLSQLRELYLDGTSITSKGLEHLSELSQLRSLSLDGTQVGDEGLVYLEPLQSMMFLTLPMGITDVGIEHLRGLRLVQELSIKNHAISNNGLYHLAELTGLRSLDLTITDMRADAEAKIDEQGLALLRKCGNLEVLSLIGTSVDDKAVEQIVHFPKIKRLFIGKSVVSDAAIPSLRQLKNLVFLDLVETQVTTEGAQQLRRALPKCKIVY
jgi:internalin A